MLFRRPERPVRKNSLLVTRRSTFSCTFWVTFRYRRDFPRRRISMRPVKVL